MPRTMAGQDYKFEGWLGYDKDSANGKLVWGEFEPKPWEETDVDIRVTHSGVCGTDIHTLRSGWVGLIHQHDFTLLTLCRHQQTTPCAWAMKLWA